jgi:hypothetical protein
VLVDFDWCAKEGEGYLITVRVNLKINWHPGVNRRAGVMKEHDLYMLHASELRQL